ncbi:MAG: MarR family transcriptional regulator [Novosphingobium sp.]|uniref:MarR family transcriptional regulator n=1 Tax=Novosphingobium sp. TaxID=1874826 RepID=UPI003C7BEC7B
MNDGKDEPILKFRLRDIGQYLIELSEEANLGSAEHSTEAQRKSPGMARTDDTPRLRVLALNEYRDRRARAKHFNANLFSEPGWDILLDLFLAKIDGLQISVTSSCLATSCPPTTALRWVYILEEQGLIFRAADIKDQRRSWLTISDDGVDRMRTYLRGKEAAGLQLGEGLVPSLANGR